MLDKQNIIEIKNLNYYYKKRKQSIVGVKNINLSIGYGEFIAFLGPDGVGKSTLFDLIAGVRKIQNENRVFVLGGDMKDSRHRKNASPDIAYMPQGLGKNLYGDLSVYENIKFFADLFGENPKEAEDRITEIMKRTDLFEFRDRPAKKLSGGMKQKLGLCCALVHNPKVLILDEPTTGVDPLSRRKFWELILDLKEEHKDMAIIVATGYMEEAEIFDRIVMMSDGSIIADGSPKDLKKQTGTKSLERVYIEMLPEKDGKKSVRFDLKKPDLSHHKIIVVAKNLTKKFGDFTAVNNINFEIKQGEIYAFLGPNGCGKTTTMKMITGLLPPTHGKHKIFGSQIGSNGIEIKKRLGYMSQNFSLYNELTVLENLDMHAGLFNLTKKKSKDKIKQSIEKFDLKEYINIKCSQLPLGIRQRLSLAVSVIHNPDLLILDEPTSGVDPLNRDRFWQLIIELSRKEGVTIFITTHYMNEAMRCDRVAMMNAGRLLDCDSPNEIIKKKKVKTLEEAFIKYMEEDEA